MEALLSALMIMSLCVKGLFCLFDVASWGAALYAGMTLTGAVTAALGFTVTVVASVFSNPLLGVMILRGLGATSSLYHWLTEKNWGMIGATLATLVLAVAAYGVLVLVSKYVPFLGRIVGALGHLQFFYVWMQLVWEWCQDGLDCKRALAKELGQWTRIAFVKLLKIFQPAVQTEMHKNTVTGLMCRIVEALVVGLQPLTTNQLAVLESQERVAGWVTGIPTFFTWLNTVVK